MSRTQRPDPFTEPVTIIEYRYADAANYKAYNTVVLDGTLTEDEIETVWAALNGREEFLPEQVGLPALQDQVCDDDEDDPAVHYIWHSMDDIRVGTRNEALTEFDPLRAMTAQQFAAQFPGIVWDETAAVTALDNIWNW